MLSYQFSGITAAIPFHMKTRSGQNAAINILLLMNLILHMDGINILYTYIFFSN